MWRPSFVARRATGFVLLVTLAAIGQQAEGSDSNSNPQAFVDEVNNAFQGIVRSIPGLGNSATETSSTSTVTTVTITTTFTKTNTTTSSTTSTTTLGPLIEDAVDYPGNDLFRVEGHSPEECLAKCEDIDVCLGFVWVKAPGQWCYLKGAKPKLQWSKVTSPAVVGGLTGEARGIVNATRPAPMSMLYCWSLIRLESYEKGMIQMQFNEGISIFQCDEYAVLSNKVVEIVQGVHTSFVDSDLKCKTGGEFGTALNNDIFKAAWTRIWDDGRYKNHDWTVKVDADCVFFPQRLRQIVTQYHEPPTGLYLNNCKFGLHGPIEVFSTRAVMTWQAGRQACVAFFNKLCSGDCFWGEDMFIDQCLTRVQHVKRVLPKTLLVEDHCDPPRFWQSCQNKEAVSLHPFKTDASYLECLASAQKAEAWNWTHHHHRSLSVVDTAETWKHNHTNVTEVKQYAQRKGYVGVELRHHKAVFKASGTPVFPHQLLEEDGVTTLLFGPEDDKHSLAAAAAEEHDTKHDREHDEHAHQDHTTTPETTSTIKSTTRSSTGSTTSGTTTPSTSSSTKPSDSSTTSSSTPSTSSPSTSSPTTSPIYLSIVPDKVLDGEEAAEHSERASTSKEQERASAASAEERGDGESESDEIHTCGQIETHPVYEFWNDEDKDHTYHFGEPWTGEERGSIQFWAFDHQAPGTEPVYDFWSPNFRDHTFHMGDALYGEEKGRIQFYAYAQKRAEVVTVNNFWNHWNTETTVHFGNAREGERLEGVGFYAHASKATFSDCGAEKPGGKPVMPEEKDIVPSSPRQRLLMPSKQVWVYPAFVAIGLMAFMGARRFICSASLTSSRTWQPELRRLIDETGIRDVAAQPLTFECCVVEPADTDVEVI